MLGSFTSLPRLAWPGKANLASQRKPNWYEKIMLTFNKTHVSL